MKQFNFKLNLNWKIIRSILISSIVLLIAVLLVVKQYCPGNNKTSTPAISHTNIEETNANNDTSDNTAETEDKTEDQTEDTTGDSDDNATVSKFTDKNKICFEKDKYKVAMSSYINIKLKIKDKSIKPSTIVWHLSDASAGEVKIKDNLTAQVHINKMGSFDLFAECTNGLYSVCKIETTVPTSFKISNVPFISQNPNYPSGCEAISATMLINYYNYDIKPETFINNYLKMSNLRNGSDGKSLIGPDPYSAFIGNPHSENSFGCYPPVIVDALNKIIKKTSSKNKAVDTTGMGMDKLINKYIINNKPVLVWATMNMWRSFKTESWTVEGASKQSPYKNGDKYYWIANEHCLVFIGYDENYYYFNDPLKSTGSVRYTKELFNQRFVEIGKCSVAIDGEVSEQKIKANF